jgi:hypothetical protein
MAPQEIKMKFIVTVGSKLGHTEREFSTIEELADFVKNETTHPCVIMYWPPGREGDQEEWELMIDDEY